MAILTIDKANNIPILKEKYILKLTQVLLDNSKFKWFCVPESKALNHHLIHLEENIIGIIKSLKIHN